MILRLDVIANAANSGLTGSMCQLYDKWIAFFAVCMLQSVHGNAGRPFPTPARADGVEACRSRRINCICRE